MSSVEVKKFDSPDETREFKGNGRVELVEVAGRGIPRATFEPGWSWSENVKPIVETDSCQVHHVSYCVSGRMRVTMNNGDEAEIGPGDVVSIPPGHNAEVIGDEACMMIDVAEDEGYAKKAGTRPWWRAASGANRIRSPHERRTVGPPQGHGRNGGCRRDLRRFPRHRHGGIGRVRARDRLSGAEDRHRVGLRQPRRGAAPDPRDRQRGDGTERLRGVITRIDLGDRTLARVAAGNSMEGVPTNFRMHFRIGSIAIPYVIDLLLQLEDKGRISLDDRLSKWFPEFPNADLITLRMLASSTTGYPDWIQENPAFSTPSTPTSSASGRPRSCSTSHSRGS